MMLGDETHEGWLIQRGQLRRLGEVPAQPWSAMHEQLFGAYLHLPCRWIVHLQALQYSVHDLPRLRGHHLYAVLHRKMAEWLPHANGETVLACLVRLHALNGLRPEERYALCRLAANEVVESLLQTLRARKVALLGIHALSHCLVKEVPPAPHALLVYQLGNTLHVTYWQQQTHYFARCVQVAAGQAMDEVLMHEIGQTRLYLIAQRWISVETPLHVHLLTVDAALAKHPMQEIDAHIRITQRPLNSAVSTTTSMIAHVLQQPMQDCPNLASPWLMQSQWQRLKRQYLVYAAVCWCVSGLAWAWHTQQATIALQHQNQNQQTSLAATLQQQPRNQTNMPVALDVSNLPRDDTARMMTTKQAQAFSALSLHQRMPDRLWHALVEVRQHCPCWQLQHVHWRNGPAQSTPEANWLETATVSYRSACGQGATTSALLRCLQAPASIASVERHAEPDHVLAEAGNSADPVTLTESLVKLDVQFTALKDIP